MAGDEQPNSMGMVVGELKGLVTGVQQMLNQQNIDSAKYRSEQATREVQSRQEFLEIFKGMRDDNKEQTKILQDAKDSLSGFAVWQADVHPKIKALWDERNGQKGFIAAIVLFSSVVSGALVAAVEYFRK